MDAKVISSFWDKVSVTGGCWEWTGSRASFGYGRFRKEPAHRWAYRFYGGVIPDGYQIDHLCCNPPCVRQEHLEAVTRRENLRRSRNPAGVNARKTHCPQGHPYDEKNTAVYDGDRYCRRCFREYNRRQRLATRARSKRNRHGSGSWWPRDRHGLLRVQLSFGTNEDGKRHRKSFTGRTRLEALRKAVEYRRQLRTESAR